MIKRIINYFWSSEKHHGIHNIEYDGWSKVQLIEKIKSLESGHGIVSSCDAKIDNEVRADSKPKKQPRKKNFDFSKYTTRFVAIKFAYLGWNYNGLSFQQEPTPLPTVEQEILNALEKAKLIKSPDPNTCNFSRCGRTDKGVSAMNQVISLNVRSTLTKEQQQDSAFDNEEIPYISILNSLLPVDIRITSICLRPPEDFDARFSCIYRHYRYIFTKKDLNLDLMQRAAQKYEGSHDFRNFCKIDGSKQITNYTRSILSSNIIHYKDDYYFFDLKGSAFLWHQVRCMVAILFAVGQGLEKPEIVDNLMNVDKFPSKPSFEMANDIPLVLFDCCYPDMEWLEPTYFRNNTSKIRKDNADISALLLDYELKANICFMLKEGSFFNVDSSPSQGGYINIGDGKGRNFKSYIPISSRDRGEAFEVVNARHRDKKRRKLQSS